MTILVDATVIAAPPPSPQFWGSMSHSKPPELGVLGPEVLHKSLVWYE
jgi:hypothetical protein